MRLMSEVSKGNYQDLVVFERLLQAWYILKREDDLQHWCLEGPLGSQINANPSEGREAVKGGVRGSGVTGDACVAAPAIGEVVFEAAGIRGTEDHDLVPKQSQLGGEESWLVSGCDCILNGLLEFLEGVEVRGAELNP